MPRSIVAAACACLLSLPATALGAQTAGGSLAHGVPANPAATYHFADTLVTSMNTPTGAMEIDITTSATLAAAFAADPEGVRVTATLQSLSTTMANPMMGSQTLEPEATGDFVFVMDPQGTVNVLATPEIEGPAGSTSAVVGMPYELFPHLPGTAAQPGDSWSNTVSRSQETPEATATTTTAYTYTLVGDTVVDGRTLVRIDIAAEVETQGTVDMGGMSADQTITGTETGFALWDTEAGQLHSMKIERNYSGSMNTPMGSMAMEISGTSHRRLEN